MRNRTLYLFIILFGMLSSTLGQDIIVLSNRAKIEAQKIVIKGKTISYQDFGEDSGTEYSVYTNKVDYIQYAGGEKLYPSEIKSTTSPSRTLGNNLINFHLLDFAVSNFTISYERVLAEGKYAVQLPISFGYGEPNSDLLLPPPFDSEIELHFSNRFSSGLMFSIFPTRQGKVRYFFGPSILFGTGVYSQGYVYDDYNGYYDPEVNTGFVSFLVNNGLIISPISHFSVSLVGSLGARHFFNVEDGKTATTGKISFNLSYRF